MYIEWAVIEVIVLLLLLLFFFWIMIITEWWLFQKIYNFLVASDRWWVPSVIKKAHRPDFFQNTLWLIPLYIFYALLMSTTMPYFRPIGYYLDPVTSNLYLSVPGARKNYPPLNDIIYAKYLFYFGGEPDPNLTGIQILDAATRFVFNDSSIFFENDFNYTQVVQNKAAVLGESDINITHENQKSFPK